MKQALLYSIAPQHLINILNGNKTIEVRKRDLPQWAKDKLAKGEDVWGYGYCTKVTPELLNIGDGTYKLSQCNCNAFNKLNGRVVVKFKVSGTTKYVDCSCCTNNENGYECQNDFMYLLSVDPILRKETCLTSDEIEDYGNGKDLYAHHLSDITPVKMELGEFVTLDIKHWYDEDGWITHWKPLTKAPQSFMTVWVK